MGVSVGVCECVKERDCVLAEDRLTVMTKHTLRCFGLVGTKQGIFYACNCSMSYKLSVVQELHGTSSLWP